MLATISVVAMLRCYLTSALLLSIGALVFAALLRWGLPSASRAPERCLVWGWALLGLALLLPWAWRATGIASAAGASVEIWNGPGVDSSATSDARLTIRFPTSHAQHGQPSVRLPQGGLEVGVALLAGGALLSLARLVARRRRLGEQCAQMPAIKRVGRVRLCASDDAPAPFAARARGLTFIVVPTSLLADGARLRLVVGHEAHHHRRGDLHAAALLGFLRVIFFWNPLLALWERTVAELQDLACDQQVLRRSFVSPLEYSRALLWAAEAVHGKRYVLEGARGITDGSFRSLKRRILMLNEKLEKSRTRSWFLGIAACGLMLGASWVVQGAVSDHRVTQAEIASLAARIEKRSGFPVFVDDRVVAKVNQWVADPDSRKFMKKAIERMPTYRAMIDRIIRARGLPVELIGMVMAESAFDNEAHPDTPVEKRSVGIWQFIPSTARRLGLEVSASMDERLEPQKATEAAAGLVTRLFARYGDWPVAIAAYNAGENKVDSIVAGATSRAEARARVLDGTGEHARYVRAVMASLIVIENPSLLE